MDLPILLVSLKTEKPIGSAFLFFKRGGNPNVAEAVLGRAGKNLGVKFATPIFDGATLDDLNEWTDKAGVPRYGKTTLYDGGTGEAFEQQATVGDRKSVV